MSFTIEIVEYKQERKLVDGKWVPGAGKDGAFGYAPDREENVIKSVEVYKQTVENLDLVAVIAAINQFQLTEEQRKA